MDSLSSKKRKALAPELAKLRAVKSESEQRIMHCAADISAHAHAKVNWVSLGSVLCTCLITVRYRRCASRSLTCPNTQ